MLDMTDSIVPRSDQLNAEDLLTGPRTFTIQEVRRSPSAEQPIDVFLVEFPDRPFKPSKTVRRIMVGAWGPDASVYAGRRMTLYRDPTVRFGGADVGGIRVSHMSHIAKPLTLALTVTRGKRAAYVVQPLKDEPPLEPGARDNGISAPQLKALHAALSGAGIKEREEGLDYISGQVGRSVSSSKDLTKVEASKVIDSLKTPPPAPAPVPEDPPFDDGAWLGGGAQ